MGFEMEGSKGPKWKSKLSNEKAIIINNPSFPSGQGGHARSGGRGRGRGRGGGGGGGGGRRGFGSRLGFASRGGGGGGRLLEKEEWIPVTKLGRLVKYGKIKTLEEIFLFSIPIKEYQIVDVLLGPRLKDEVIKIMPVQKQTTAGQRTRFKAYIAVGDGNGHIGLGVKCSSIAIRGGIVNAKMNMIPVRRGYWGLNVGV